MTDNVTETVTDYDRSAMLASLRIRRDPSPPLPTGQSRPRRWIAVGATGLAVLAGVAGGAWYLWPANLPTIRAVTAESLEGAPTNSGLDASGYIVARSKATLSAKILGKLTQLYFDEGDHVNAGDIVAKLDDSNYRAAYDQARAVVNSAKVTLDITAPIYARYRTLKSEGAISTDAVENQRLAYENALANYQVANAAAETARTYLDDTLVRAPFSGIVTVKVAHIGEVVAPQAGGGGDTRTGIVTIVDMSSLEVQVDVSENYIDRVRPGAPASIHLDAYPEWEVPGQVIAIIPTADQSKGTVGVRVAIQAKDSRILPQMAARVTFHGLPAQGTVAVAGRVRVPIGAIISHGRTADVFVIRDDATLEKRTVTLGAVSGQSVVIASGIRAGDQLAAGNLAALQPGEKVKVSNTGS